MQGGMQVLHATAVLATGALSEAFPVPVVVGAWSAIGLVLIATAAHHWPSPRVIEAGIAHARQLNERPAGGTTTPAPPLTQPNTNTRRTAGRRGGDPLDDAAGSTAPVHL
jgi:hypothetical protein